MTPPATKTKPKPAELGAFAVGILNWEDVHYARSPAAAVAAVASKAEESAGGNADFLIVAVQRGNAATAASLVRSALEGA